MTRDPICDMEVDEQTAEFKSEYGSQTYYFCSEECKEQFETEARTVCTCSVRTQRRVCDLQP